MQRITHLSLSLLFSFLFFLGGCAANSPDSLISPASFVEEAAYPSSCETIKERLKKGLAEQRHDIFFYFGGEFEEIPGNSGECGRFVHSSGFMGSVDVIILLEDPNYGKTNMTIYQPYRSSITTDLARSIMEIAGGTL